ncbi:MAG: transposase [Pseudomonadota bacterium]|nr:transposase [Pseudomonadota bacterium]
MIDDRIPSCLRNHVAFPSESGRATREGAIGRADDVLRTAFRSVRARHPFHLEALLILPDHIHCVWTLAPGDAVFSTRRSLIKEHFSLAIEKRERISQSRAKRGGQALWHRRFGEHLIRDQADFNRHVDDIHYMISHLCGHHGVMGVNGTVKAAHKRAQPGWATVSFALLTMRQPAC